MIYYINKLNNMFQPVNYLITFYFKKIYESITNYIFKPSKKNISLIKPINIVKKQEIITKKSNFKVIKSISYNILPNSFTNNPILTDIYENNNFEYFEIFNFDYNVKYLSPDKLYGWYIDIEEREKFIYYSK